MILPAVKGTVNVKNNSFYFAADSAYFTSYGKSLCLSLKKFAPWANIHVHLFNPTADHLNWLVRDNVTTSYEYIDADLKEIKTYYACVRFIRIPEIFDDAARIISLDADGIAVRPITEEKFLYDTESSKVLWREKQQQSLASSLFFGPDNFRHQYAQELISYFLTDNFNWFLDQNILDYMVTKKIASVYNNRDWGNSKIGKKTLIWSAKGNRKNNEEFQELVQQYIS